MHELLTLLGSTAREFLGVGRQRTMQRCEHSTRSFDLFLIVHINQVAADGRVETEGVTIPVEA